MQVRKIDAESLFIEYFLGSLKNRQSFYRVNNLSLNKELDEIKCSF